MGDEEEEEVLGSGQSASTNSLPPPADSTLLKLNHLDIHADDAVSHASLALVFSPFSFLYFSIFSNVKSNRPAVPRRKREAANGLLDLIRVEEVSANLV